MSKTKDFYHDEICKGQQEAVLDADYQFDQFVQDEQEKLIEQQAEEEVFFRIFELTNTYPV
jgi:hypothetical protein